jgi:hypothetical protein
VELLLLHLMNYTPGGAKVTRHYRQHDNHRLSSDFCAILSISSCSTNLVNMNSGLQGYEGEYWDELFPTFRRLVVPSFFYGIAGIEEVVHIFSSIQRFVLVHRWSSTCSRLCLFYSTRILLYKIGGPVIPRASAISFVR